MRAYDRVLGNAFESTAAYAGNLWSMHRILTPLVMAALEQRLEEAETAHAEFPDFHVPIMMRYWQIFHQPTMDAAEAVERDGIALVDFPDVWKAYLDDALVGESLGLYDPRSPKTSWMDLKTFSATIDEQGFPYYRGSS